jgi:hypothetical protein
MKSDDLSPNEIVARGDVFRDMEPDVTAVVVHVLGSPELHRRSESGYVRDILERT